MASEVSTATVAAFVSTLSLNLRFNGQQQLDECSDFVRILDSALGSRSLTLSHDHLNETVARSTYNTTVALRMSLSSNIDSFDRVNNSHLLVQATLSHLILDSWGTHSCPRPEATLVSLLYGRQHLCDRFLPALISARFVSEHVDSVRVYRSRIEVYKMRP